MPTTQIRFLDFIKAIACNLIVLHHLAFYGPMSDYLRPIVPEVIDWFSDYAHIAVQAFLAIGGFLAAKSLSARHSTVRRPFHAVARRFLKLAPPFVAAMLFAIIASTIASHWMDHESISGPPTLAQFAAHAFLLHGVLGYESLSAGAWYVAIDFQLYALLTLVLWLAARKGLPSWVAPLLVIFGTAASLLVFNRDPEWDNWAPYFFGSYGLGALAWWASERYRGTPGAPVLTLAILVLGVLALELDFRSRIAVALGIALAIIAVCQGGLRLPGQDSAVIAYMGRISYGVFLMHFPVSLVVNAAFTRFAAPVPEVQALGIILAWTASLAVGAAFHHWIELPLGRITSGTSTAQGAKNLRSVERRAVPR